MLGARYCVIRRIAFVTSRKAVIGVSAMKVNFFYASIVGADLSECANWKSRLRLDLNGWFGDIGRNAAMSVLRLRADAASANTRKRNGGKVRKADSDWKN